MKFSVQMFVVILTICCKFTTIRTKWSYCCGNSLWCIENVTLSLLLLLIRHQGRDQLVHF